MLHLIREKIHTYPQEAMRVNGSFDSQFMHLIKSTVNKFGVQSSASALAENRKYMCIFFVLNVKPPEMLSIKRVRFIIPARKGISIVARVRWQKQTSRRYVYIFFVLNVENTKMLSNSIKRVRFIILAR